MPLYSAKPPQTPPAIESVRLLCSWGRTGGVGCSEDGGRGCGAEVMAEACRATPSLSIGEHPEPTLVPLPREAPVPPLCRPWHGLTSTRAPVVSTGALL